MPHSETEEEPALSEEAAAALAQFLAEKTAEEEKGVVNEDWQLSQFWYDDATARSLAQECVRAAGEGGRVAFVSCPTAFSALAEPGDHVLLEFDPRFQSTFPEHFVPYDYKQPLALPSSLKGVFDVVILDPPFLASECLVKSALTARFLGKAEAKLLVCTGAVMEETVEQLLGARPTPFLPQHANNLANHFRCYANYQCPLSS